MPKGIPNLVFLRAHLKCRSAPARLALAMDPTPIRSGDASGDSSPHPTTGVPTSKEINPWDSLDGETACKNFLGKTLDEAEALFRENSLLYQEDLLWMGPIAFRYYVAAAMRYIQSEGSLGDPDFISCFVGILELRQQQEPAELAPISEQLIAICDYIMEHFDKFDMQGEIYGDVAARVKSVRQRFA
jgi:hypothetical protein